MKELYVTRKCGLAVKVENAKGGGPDSIFATALKLIKAVPRDWNIIVMDADSKWTTKLCEAARKKNITLCGASPCMDGLLLRILGQKVPTNSPECKRLFESSYLDSSKKLDKRNYAGLITKDLVDKVRSSIPELDAIITILERR